MKVCVCNFGVQLPNSYSGSNIAVNTCIEERKIGEIQIYIGNYSLFEVYLTFEEINQIIFVNVD